MTTPSPEWVAQRRREAERPLWEHLAWLERAGRLAVFLASEAARAEPLPVQRPMERVRE
jgi:hypothetical protein